MQERTATHRGAISSASGPEEAMISSIRDFVKSGGNFDEKMGRIALLRKYLGGFQKALLAEREEQIKKRRIKDDTKA